MNDYNDMITTGIPDFEFIRGDVPISKEEIRTIAIAKLRLGADSTLLDIGAGTGSITVEAARLLKRGRVHAVEMDEPALDLINRNIEKFKVANVTVHRGAAPGALAGIAGFDRVFIGGSGGSLAGILEWVHDNIGPGGRIVVNAITLDTLHASRQFFADRGYRDVEIIQVAISKIGDAGGGALMLRAQNPVFIISTRREER